MKSFIKSRIATRIVAFVVVAVVAVIVAISSMTVRKWVGHKDLLVQFEVTDQETGLPIKDAAIHIRLEDGGGFYENRDKPQFDLMTDEQGRASYKCKDAMCDGSKGLFEDKFAIHLPWWTVHASAIGCTDSASFYVDVPERRRQVDRGDKQARLELKIALRGISSNHGGH